MAYTPDPTNPATPTVNDLAGNMAYEFQALKGYLQTVLANGSNFYNNTSYRNLLKNSRFQIFQRAFSGIPNLPLPVPIGEANLTLDQWTVFTPDGTAGGALGVFQGGGPYPNDYAMLIIPNAGSSRITVGQRVESADCVGLTIGTHLTISGYYIATGVDDLIGPQFYVLTPTSGNKNDFAGGTSVASNTVQIEFPNFVTDVWMYFKATVVLTQDCSAGIDIQLIKYNPVISIYYGYARMQLEKGAVATPFEIRPIALEQELCNRYCRKGLMNSGAPTATAAGQSFLQWVQFGSPMFKVPLTTILSHTETNTGPVGITNATHTGLEVTTNSLAAGVVSFQLGWLAEADL